MLTAQQQFIIGIIVIIIIIGLIVASIGSKHYGRHNFPCYCKTCETVLITEAAKGNPAATQALKMALQDGTVTKLSDVLAPVAVVISFIALVAVVSGGTYVYFKVFKPLIEKAYAKSGLQGIGTEVSRTAEVAGKTITSV
jgi:hypothetical protein